MAEQTLCHIINKNKLLLKKATRGVSQGMWNGLGGKIDENESSTECVIREVKEETGLDITDLQYHGLMQFYFHGKNEPLKVHLYSTTNFEGEPRGTEEGELQWFNINELPYEQMWEDDKYWLNHMLENKKFNANFYFNENKKITKYEIELI